jgi:hypothetical protein
VRAMSREMNRSQSAEYSMRAYIPWTALNSSTYVLVKGGRYPAVWTRRHPERLHADFVGLDIVSRILRLYICDGSVRVVTSYKSLRPEMRHLCSWVGLH